MSVEPIDAVLSSAMRSRLEQRLDDWGREYLTPQRIGMTDRNILQTLMEHGGFVPGGGGVKSSRDRTPADQVEDIVLSMRRAGWWLHAGVLRLEYWRPSLPMESKLDRLQDELRANLSRREFYRKLDEARLFVAGGLFA